KGVLGPDQGRKLARFDGEVLARRELEEGLRQRPIETLRRAARAQVRCTERRQRIGADLYEVLPEAARAIQEQLPVAQIGLPASIPGRDAGLQLREVARHPVDIDG